MVHQAEMIKWLMVMEYENRMFHMKSGDQP